MAIDTSHKIFTDVTTPTFPPETYLEGQVSEENFYIEHSVYTAVEDGLDLLHIGLNVIPLDENLQAPELLFKNLCTSTSLSDMTWITMMRNFDNVGVITGKKSQNLFVVRCNTLEAYEYLEAHLGSKMGWVSKTSDCWDAWFFCAEGVVSNRRYSHSMTILGHEKVVEFPGCRSANGITSEWIKYDYHRPHVLYKEEMDEFFPNVMIMPFRDTNDAAHSIEKYKQAMSIINDPENLTDIDKAYIFSETHYFGNGTSGAGKKSVFRALIARGQIESIYNFRASLRELEAISTPCRKTISKYLNEFERKGLIEHLSESPLGNRYKLKKCKIDHIKKLPLNVENLINLPPHDIWTSRSGLGACTKEIVELLIALNKKNLLYTAKDISNNLTVSYPTVLKRLKQLRALGLAVKIGGRWKIVVENIEPSNFDGISKKLGVDGKYKTRKKQTDFDRQKYSVFLSEINKKKVCI